MRLVTILMMLLVLTVPAGAASKRKQCKQACQGMITACTTMTSALGFGNVKKGCKKAVLKRCKKEGPAVCGAFCGDGVAGAGEACDGADLGGATCESVGFAGGTLGCGVGCQVDTGGCVPGVLTTCGNGVKETAEPCDGLDLGGATCESLGFLRGTLACTTGCGYDVSGCEDLAFPATGQTTCWDSTGAVIEGGGTGHDGDIRAGAPLSYTDNGDGTITDRNTGLMWEKKSDDGSIHDKDTTYLWADAFVVHVATLNSTVFAGYTDWRVPNVKELQSIIDYERARPAVDPVFNDSCSPGCTVTTCSCTAASLYWSSTSYAPFPNRAWYVFLTDGYVSFGFKDSDDLHVRAVRGGL
jgi:hypothetical protein